jgi:Competence protein
VSLVSPLANAVAIPVASLFVKALTLAGSVLPSPLANLVLGRAHLAIVVLVWPLTWLSAPALAAWTAPAPTPWILVLALAGAAWMLAPRGWPQRWANLSAWTPLLTHMAAAPAAGRFDIMKSNARSCVLRISAGGKAILLAGDIEAAQEAALLDLEADRLRADVLLAPHHGSGTSSSAAFLQAVAPTVGIFQVGHRNRYRHPQKTGLCALRRHGHRAHSHR